MEAGRLRHKLRIQANTETRASDGGLVYAWATAAVRWASIEPLTGRELQEASATWGRLSHKITIRYWAGLTAEHRIVTVDGDGDPVRIFNIVAPLNKAERNIDVECLCLEAPADGA